MKTLLLLLTFFLGLGLAVMALAAEPAPASHATAPVAGNALPDFPGIASIPIPKNMDFGGFFKTHQPVKVMFGVSDPGAQLKESLTNAALIIRYLKSRGYRYNIDIVLYGKAVQAADSFNQQFGGYAAQLDALHQQGVTFSVCYNSLESLNIDSDTVYDYMTIVPAGILQIVKKQLQGFAYISNK